MIRKFLLIEFKLQDWYWLTIILTELTLINTEYGITV